MGMCEPSGGINRIDDEHHLPDEGEPNSRSDLYKNGKLKQQRWYGSDGKAAHDRDYEHAGPMDFPHDHAWDWTKISPRGSDHVNIDPNFN